MSTTLNKKAYEDLIMSYIAALEKHMPEFSLEKKHIIETLKWSVSAIYDKNTSPEYKPDEMDFFKEIEMEMQMKREMDKIYEEENKLLEEEKKSNDRILNAITKTLGQKYLDAVVDCLRESEAQGKLELVRIKGEPQDHSHYQEEDWEEFDHILVDQYVNGGYLGDDFAGDIYIPLRGNLYLKSYYSM